MLKKETSLNGGGVIDNNLYRIYPENYGYSFGYGKPPVISDADGDTLGSINKDQLKIGDEDFTILCLYDSDVPDTYTFFALDKALYNQSVYICKKDDSTVFTIDGMVSSNIYFSLYLLKPTYTYFFDDTSKPYYDVWIATTPPPWI